jgi:hypothetical protein
MLRNPVLTCSCGGSVYHVVFNGIKPEIWPRKSGIWPPFNWLMTSDVLEEFGARILRLQVVHEERTEDGSRKLLRDIGIR